MQMHQPGTEEGRRRIHIPGVQYICTDQNCRKESGPVAQPLHFLRVAGLHKGPQAAV